MADDTTKKTPAGDTPTDPSELSDAEKEKLIRKQQADIERLTRELDSLRRKQEETEASHKAMVRKAKVEKLLADWEEAGREFESDEARTAEQERLMKLTDEGFEATVATVQSFAAAKKKKKPEDEEEQPPEDEDEEDPKKRKPKPKKQGSMRSDAGVAPAASPDTRGTTLQERLASGFMAAYKDRIGTEG